MNTVEGVPLDFTLSPYTGWTRGHWERILARLTYGYVRVAEKQGSPARALYPDDYRDKLDAVDALESFARIATAWGAWLHNPQNPATLEFSSHTLNLEEVLSRALIEGTNAKNPQTYWGAIGDLDQRIVEAADVALVLWLSRERVFERMRESERDQIISWLAQVDDKETSYSNWILFPVLPMTVRLKLGYPVDVNALDTRLDQVAAFYRGDGWYADGVGAEFELYNAWMFGWHYLFWAWIDGARRPQYCETVLRRAQSFLAGFQHFFGANGAYPAWGRSLVYRFAAISCFASGHLLNIAPLSPGAMRRLSSGCLKYFYEHECIEPQRHFLRQGFHGDFPQAGEAYISPGSPSWACHGLFGLTFDLDDPFWTATEEPLPVERADFDLALPTPGFMISGRRETGHVFLLNGGSGHPPENPRHHYISKYGKFAYSTHFPFNVLPAGESYAPDAMVALTRDDCTFSHRFINGAYGVAPGVMWCEFVEIVDDEPQLVRVAILMWRDIQVRLAFVQPTRRVRVVEAPGALGAEGAASVMRRSNQYDGWEYAEADGRAVAIKRLCGYDDQKASVPFLGYSNINLAYPYAEQPLVTELAPSISTRSFATAVLLRPAPFDPSREFSDINVTAEKDGSFRARLPDGTHVYVSLANELREQVQLDGAQVVGDGVRCVWLAADRSRVTAIGVSRIADVCELSAAGTFQLKREAKGVAHVTTNAGVTLSSDWFGDTAEHISARTLDGAWWDVTDQCAGNQLPDSLVREWARRIERTLVEFRFEV